ncbi:hypothetical protein ACFCX0_00010 [Streptomyces sp. NPDC056352]|uniref:hypothetical protein n=1 Tax=Streptomyces sp. NPDC056352 TaxID=3345791 RepID=UPI0035D71614
MSTKRAFRVSGTGGSAAGPAHRSRPTSRRLAEDERGLPAVAEFFAGLIKARRTGEYTRRGCMVTRAHAGAEDGEPDVRAVLDQHHQGLRDAVRAALRTAEERGRPSLTSADPPGPSPRRAKTRSGGNWSRPSDCPTGRGERSRWRMAWHVAS